jgi:hypothetical protein
MAASMPATNALFPPSCFMPHILEFIDTSVTLHSVPRYRIKENLMTTAELTIGKLAEAAGVNIETIRYYQRRGFAKGAA